MPRPRRPASWIRAPRGALLFYSHRYPLVSRSLERAVPSFRVTGEIMRHRVPSEAPFDPISAVYPPKERTIDEGFFAFSNASPTNRSVDKLFAVLNARRKQRRCTRGGSRDVDAGEPQLKRIFSGRDLTASATISINHPKSGANVGWHFKSIARARLKREEGRASRAFQGSREKGNRRSEPTRGKRRNSGARRPVVLASASRGTKGQKRNEGARHVFDVQKVIMGWFPVIISRAH